MISTHSDTTDLESSSHFQTILSADNEDSTTPRGCHQDLNLAPRGVEAGNDLPAGASISLGMTETVLGRDLLEEQKHHRESTYRTPIKVYWRDGRLESRSDDDTSATWMQPMRSARDRHEQNVELVRGEAGLCAVTMRHIGRGEELLIWYGEGLAREMGVPILTPCHIRGHQEYVCTGCQARFTHPNTLKAHISLQCNESKVQPITTDVALVPFHRLLQTISKASASPSAPAVDKETILHRRSRDSGFPVPISPRSRPSCSSCDADDSDDKLSHRSAFRTPSTSRDTKREAGSDDGLMTPDSSTDQKSALNLSIKSAQVCGPVDHIREMPPHAAIHPWNAFAAQQFMAQTMSIPFDYPPLPGCYPVSPHLHALGIQLMNCGQATLQQSHPYGASMDRSVCGGKDYPLISPQMDEMHERPHTFKPNSSALSPSLRQVRPANPYGFSLPSDKEPLDLLPQAYFANKSKKGHLCLCCGKLYSRKYGLKIHMRTHNGYKPLKCKICSRPFGDPSNLNKHVRLHAQGETPYRCEYCGKVLVRRRDLERHVRSRHPMGCVQTDDAVGVVSESSPDSSPVSVEGSEHSMAPKEQTCSSS